MKKGLLLVLAVLLVAGLFVSCNSDVSANAGASSKDHAYVTFDKASAPKSVSPTVNPADAPSIDDLYWYYKAIKASGTVHEGEKKEWTRVNSSTGLSGTIGPFSVGEWYFELVGIMSESDPGSYIPTATFNPEADTDKWTNIDECARFVGVSGTSGYETRSFVVISGNQAAPTFIPVSLEQVNVSNAVTINFGGLTLVGAESIADNSKVWLEVFKGDDKLGETIVVTAASGAVIPDAPSADATRSFNLASPVESVTLTFKLYDTSNKNYLVKDASISVLVSKGSTVTLSGSLDAIEAYGTFDSSAQYEAYIVKSNGSVELKQTFGDALNGANEGETVVLLKDVVVDVGSTGYGYNGIILFYLRNNINIDGNYHSVSLSNVPSNTKTGFIYYDTETEGSIKISNLNITSSRFNYVVTISSTADVTATVKNVNIESDNCCLTASGEHVDLTATNSTFAFSKGAGTRSDYLPASSPVAAQYGSSVTLNNCSVLADNGGCLLVWPSGGALTVNNSNLSFGGINTFAAFAWIGNGGGDATKSNSVITLSNTTVSDSTATGKHYADNDSMYIATHLAKNNNITTNSYYAEVIVNNVSVAKDGPHENTTEGCTATAYSAKN